MGVRGDLPGRTTRVERGIFIRRRGFRGRFSSVSGGSLRFILCGSNVTTNATEVFARSNNGACRVNEITILPRCEGCELNDRVVGTTLGGTTRLNNGGTILSTRYEMGRFCRSLKFSTDKSICCSRCYLRIRVRGLL